MTFKSTTTFETLRLLNLSFALGILVFMAISQTAIGEFVFNALNAIQWPDQISHVVAIALNWWLPSALLFVILRFTNLLDWLKFNRLTQWAFLVANIALLGELVFILLYGRDGYFIRVYFEAPWKIGLMVGGSSLVGCTIWYQVIKRYSLVRNTLSVLLTAD